MALIAEQRIVPTGITVAFVAANALGDAFYNSGQQKVRLKNGSGAPITVTVDTPVADNFGVSNNILDVTLTVPAGGEISAGPFNPARHNDAQGKVQLTYSGVTSLTLAVTN